MNEDKKTIKYNNEHVKREVTLQEILAVSSPTAVKREETSSILTTTPNLKELKRKDNNKNTLRDHCKRDISTSDTISQSIKKEEDPF